MQATRPSRWLAAVLLALLACASAAFAATGPGRAAVASKVDLWSAADCSAHADLDVTFSGAGIHSEFGRATDEIGNTIGAFGPRDADKDTYTGQFEISIVTAQRANSVIGSYGWVGSNPPTPTGAVEFFVLYNCTSKIVLYRCMGSYGNCPTTAPEALHVLALQASAAPSVPTLSPAALFLLSLGFAGAAAFVLRQRKERSPPGLGTGS